MLVAAVLYFNAKSDKIMAILTLVLSLKYSYTNSNAILLNSLLFKLSYKLFNFFKLSNALISDNIPVDVI